MRLADAQRFGAASVDWFHRLLGAAMLSMVASEASSKVLDVHAGRLFPYRHLPGVPLYGVPALLLEWAATAAIGLSLMAGTRLRVTMRLALLIALVGISQRYSNHRALLVIVTAFAALDPAEPRDADFSRQERPNLALVRAQLILVYLASGVDKVRAGFLSGDALVNLLGLSPALARQAAIVTVVMELALPFLLLGAPRLGILLAAALHLAFAYAIPSTWSFGFLMLAMAVLFVPPPPLPPPIAPLAPSPPEPLDPHGTETPS